MGSKKLKQQPNHTRISYMLSILAIVIFMYLSLKYGRETGDLGNWGKFSYLQAGFAIIGFVGYQFITQESLLPKIYRQLDIDTILYSVLTLVAILFVQLVAQVLITITGFEQIAFTLGAAIAEELYFRAFLISAICYALKNTKIEKPVAIIISASAFAAAHVNYYGNFAVLISVFVSGIVYGVVYLKTRNITVTIFAHLVNNVIVVLQMVGYGYISI